MNKIKKKSFLRTEAVVPFIVVVVVTWGYFHFFFDYHMKKALEFVGYQVIGAEVDIQKLETSFIHGTFRMQGLEITNSQNPDHDMVAIGDIRFGILWDGLLRARFVVDEMAVEQIQIDIPRKSPGKVKPPEPPKKDEGPSALEKAANEMKEKALKQTEKKNSGNALGDLASLLSGNSETGNIEGNLASKKKLEEMQTVFNEKQKGWNQKLQSLPKNPEIQALGDKLGKIKTSNFKSPQDLVDSLNQLKAVAEEGQKKYQVVQQTGQEMDSDLKAYNDGLKELDALVKKDQADLEAKFHIPKIDAKSLAEGVFRSYLDPYLGRMNEYKNMAEKYMPPKVLKKGSSTEVDDRIQPHPREKGVTYEFGRPKAYPMFWIRKISVSSKASASLGTGDMAGEITDIASNQTLVGKPTVAALKGDFPSLQILGFNFKGVFDNLKEKSKISYETSIDSYPIVGRPLVDSQDVQITFTKADATFSTKGELEGLRDLSFSLQNSLKKVDYQINAQNPTVGEILKSVFAALPVVNLDVQGSGHLPALNLAINSNLGPELQKGFEREVKKKIDEARAKIQKYLDDNVGKKKAELEAQYAKMKSQIDEQVAKIKTQLDSQKKQSESKQTQAQKDGENKAKKQMQDQGSKAVDDLKKKFGL